MHEVRRRWQEHVRRERAQQDKIDFVGTNLPGGETLPHGLDGQVAGGDARRRMPPLGDAGPLEDPIGIVAQRGEVLVADPQLGQVTAHRYHLHAHQAAEA